MDESMIDKMKTLVRRQDSCVLATTDGAVPHCSLMAYIVDENCENLYLVTPRRTLKYDNICRHPHVSLLIDTRGEADRGRVMALTVAGTCSEVVGETERTDLLERFAAAHPHLDGFIRAGETAFLCVAIRTLQLLDGPDRAHYATLDR